MAKVSAKQIDRDEKKVIAELQKNSKESIDKIAKRCGFSRQKVWRIIKRLEKNRTIWGYNAVVDNDQIDRKSYLMLIKRSNNPINEAVDKIISHNMDKEGEKMNVSIRDSCYLHGPFDWLIVFTCPNIKQAKKFSEVITREYHNVINDVQLMENIFTVKSAGIDNPFAEKLREFI